MQLVPQAMQALVRKPSQQDEAMIEARRQAGLLPRGVEKYKLVAPSWDTDLSELHLADLLLNSSSEDELKAGFAADSHTKYQHYIKPVSQNALRRQRSDGRLDAAGVFA